MQAQKSPVFPVGLTISTAVGKLMSQKSVDRDRVTINGEKDTFLALFAEPYTEFEIPHPGLQNKTWTHVYSYFVEVDKNSCAQVPQLLASFPSKGLEPTGLFFGHPSLRPH